MNAAARLVTGTHKFDHGLSRLLHDDLHLLDVPERMQYKIGVTVHRCLQSKAPKYLTDCCTPVSEIASRRDLGSASRRYRLTTFGRRAFSVAGPTVWNSTGQVSETRLSAAAISGNYLRRTSSTVTQHTQRMTLGYINVRLTIDIDTDIDLSINESWE